MNIINALEGNLSSILSSSIHAISQSDFDEVWVNKKYFNSSVEKYRRNEDLQC